MSTRKSFVDSSDISSAVYDLSSTTNGISAAGTNQATATALGTTTYQRVTTAAASTGVKLPAAVAGMRIVVFNKGANTLAVYPATGGIINDGAANAAFSGGIAAQKAVEFVCVVDGTWDSIAGA